MNEGKQPTCYVTYLSYLIVRDFVKRSVAGLSWKSGLDQSVVAAENCCRISDTFCFEISHRTGAGMLGRSRAVSDDHLVARQFPRAGGNFIVGNIQGALNMTGLVGSAATHVNQHRLILL